MNRRIRYAAIAAAALGCFSAAQARENPNIILILADDLGYGDVGFNGCEQVQTPHLDRLAREGMVFHDFHSNGAACTPTRAALLTGRYQQRSGLVNALFVGNERQLGHGLSPQEILIPEVLKDAGYVSAVFGKWHVGSEPGAHPLNQGFDRFVGNIEGHMDYISKWNRKWYDWNSGFEKFEEEGYVTHLLTRHTIDFIRENREQPFFIFLSHACPHTPHMLPDDEPMYGTSNPKVTVQPEKYVPMIEEMDKGVGEILAALDETGLSEKTMVIFTSDNGPHHNAGTAQPYRGNKGDVYEGGHRVPFAIRWPGTIPAGSHSSATAITMDLMPTFLELAGLSHPRPLDGLSLVPVLLENRSLPERTLFWDNGRGLAVRDGDLKLVRVQDRKTRQWSTELYNLKTDPSEQEDLAGQKPEAFKQLEEKLESWRQEVHRNSVNQPVYDVKKETVRKRSVAAPMSGSVVKNDFQGMPYQLYVPETEEGDELPLVVCLHGALGRGDDNAGRGIHAYDVLRSPEVQAEHPCFLLVPQCAAGSQWVDAPWADGSYDLDAVPESSHIKKTAQLISQIVENYPTDPTRVYATGQSMGGFGCWDLILRYPGLFAAAVPVCGGGSPRHAERIKGIPVWVFHGRLDDVVPVSASRDMVNALKAVGGQLEKYSEYPRSGHVIMESVWRAPGLIDWLFEQKKDGGIK
jgi:arylsulfatase A